MTQKVAREMATAAIALRMSFDKEQRKAACKAFTNAGERRLWYFTPTDHGGLALADMSTTQHRIVHRLVATGLSPEGYNTVAAIMGLENILDRLEGFKVDFGRQRGRDPLLYYITLFGDPAGESPWGWRFGGHHVSLHYTIIGGVVSAVTPSFLGADPAESALLGPHLHRPLAAAEDLGRELFRSLGSLKDRALISAVAPVDIATGNRPEVSEGDKPMGLPDVWRKRFIGETAELLANMQSNAEALLELTEEHIEALKFTHQPKGLCVEAMDDEHRAIFDALLNVYLNRLPDELATEQAQLVAAERSHLTFGWAGGQERYQPHYYRIQGRRVLIEYDNTQRGANHIHTVWRDLTNDFGGDVLVRHYARSTHH